MGQMEVPAENGGKDDGWSVNGDSSGQATLYQKKDGGQRAGGKVKTVLQELISGIDFKLVIDRDDGNRENYHRNWQAEIKLYEAEPVFVGLSGCGKKGDGAGLGGHDGNTDDPPGVRSEEHTSELQSLMRNSYAVFCLKKK